MQRLLLLWVSRSGSLRVLRGILLLLAEFGEALADNFCDLTLIVIVFFDRDGRTVVGFREAFKRERDAERAARYVDSEIGDLFAALHLVDHGRLDRGFSIATRLIASCIG